MNEIVLSATINGREHRDRIAPQLMLVDYLRETLDLRGARIGCARGVCGACTVLLDGQPVASCSLFAFQIDGRAVTTIEGLAQGDTLDPVQQAFIDHAAFQCGYCTGGMILLVKAMLTENPHPDRATIVDWLSSNVCRCTGYAQIIAAVEDLVARRGEHA